MEIEIKGANPPGRLELSVGERLTVVLDGNPTTGYQWQVASLTGEVLEWAEGPTYSPSVPQRIGSGGTYRFGFKALGKGRGSVKLVYRRSWEEGVLPIRTVMLKVKVR